MRHTITWAMGLLMAANGVFMVATPERWSTIVPGVPAPFNAHFVRDIGLAYLVAGVAIGWLARGEHARPAARAGAAFLVLHALLHLVEALAGGHAWHLLRDLPGVFAPAALAVWVAWTPRAAPGDLRMRGRVTP